MKDKGQVFTFDMLLALIITMLVLSSSGLALKISNETASNYISRYSLERITNDSADVLVKSPGKPPSWENNVSELKVPGLARVKKNSENAVPNSIDSEKIEKLARLMTEDQWDSSKSQIQAIRKLFGGTNNFEIKIMNGENTLRHLWPKWDIKNSSSVENSLEVATSTRLIYTRAEIIKYKTDPIVRLKPGVGTIVRRDNFYLYDNELEKFDWYVVIETAEREENRPENVRVKIGEDGALKYKWSVPQTGDQTKEVFPSSHGGMENNNPPPPKTGLNSIQTKVWQDPSDNTSNQWAKVYVSGVPHCSKPKKAIQGLERVPVTLRVKIWR